ncbi:MAG: glycosyltransferase, partial [Cyclobacteriaceae bacterium]
HQVRRVQADGSFGRPNAAENMDLIYRSQITQISRWDKLKGFQQLMEAFIFMKKTNREKGDPGSLDYRRTEMAMLVLGGPDPAFVSDDPEGRAVLDELTEIYSKIDPALQNDIAILLLPLHDSKENALIVNALQRSSSFVIQNSIHEGFGLTATEAMWKRIPMLVSGAAGLRFQVEDRVTGRINDDATDIESLGFVMKEMLDNPKGRDKWGLNGQIRVIREFTLFSQLLKWMKVFTHG